MKSFKAYKFRISSPEQSERLQQVLFKLGYSWGAGSTTVGYTEAKRLDTWKDGIITYTDNWDFVACNNSEEKDTEKFIAKYSGKKKAKKKWHSVAEDGLPDIANKCYLVYCENDKCQYMAYVDDLSGNWMSWILEGIGKEIVYQNDITHWREMPKNP